MKAVVLLSGGADSATCLAIAVKENGKENVSALSVFYGQRHAKETESAQKVAEYYGVPLYHVDLSATYQYSNCPLLSNSEKDLPMGSYEEQSSRSTTGAVATYVPFRNGLMLSSAGALALSLYPEQPVKLYYGAHRDDALGGAYPDCTPEFVSSMGSALKEGSGGWLELCAPLISLNKAGVIATGASLSVPYELTWSCYAGGEKHCGKCGTCIDRKKAFEIAGVPDPTIYEE